MSAAAASAAERVDLAGHLQDVQRLCRRAALVVLCGLLPLAAWMALAPLASAVVASGHVKVDLDRRPVQHAEGGTVLQVLVRDGQAVRQGEPMLVLGDVAVDADRNRLAWRLMAERAGLVRLDAEQLMAAALQFPSDLLEAAADDARLAAQLDKERQLFATRRDALQRQVQLLQAQRGRVAEEIDALQAQLAKAADSLGFQKAELETNRRLLGDGFISPTRVAQLEGAVADYASRIEERRSELARAGQRMTDTQLRISALDGDYRQQAGEQRRAAAARVSELEQELRKSADAAQRQVIRAPVAGVVLDLKYPAAGAVIAPRETVADIVPVQARLLTDARIRTEDIDRVAPGQPAQIRFTAFKARTTPMVDGKVIYLSPDRLLDRATNLPYYAVQVEVDPASLARAGELKLQAGMPAEVFLPGDSRTPLRYLLEPIADSMRRAARER
ncbi:HlyD family type I secretion periplasmic adaptor subunit [Ramlibacter tataouinensis]|uniref:HlyD family type I secretion periplasmic adaptor subunit n=1 Tax=Ramlibacter tataouinensis TaxID=94132 RepID=UPI0022F3C634|nr:HlyD family type I secretion periplasmic adaptor subunit [Ramlibacter tataouinensis]WBY02419.1 HlyD family type I secretion periplasmic adaptor subunit [Ramlibacter tataouinensis]